MNGELVYVAVFAAGCMMGAWLTHRKQSRMSPMPTNILKMPGSPVEDEEYYENVPEDKRTTV